MKLRFAKMNPTENMTILVLSPVERRDQPEVAAKLMAQNSLGAEQVGFLEESTLPGALNRLQMMGGEFCGNATMSLAALHAFEENLPDGAQRVYPLEISGAARLLNCRIVRQGNGYVGSVDMPLPEEILMAEPEPGLRLPVVRFPGIAHVIVQEDRMDPAASKAVIARWCRQLQADALGILLVNSDMNRIRPLVYVRETDSSVWERGCGSGTAAMGAYLAYSTKRDAQLSISQPGGVISVKADYCGGVSRIEITGRVQIAAIGEAFVDE